jgi:hypothetical protein
MKDIQCACTMIVSQYHVRAGKHTFWVTREHKAPCGRPCSLSPGSLVGDCHIPGKCELCPTQRKPRRGPRVRVKAEATASPILGQLTANEVRVLNYAITARLDEGRYWVHAPIISKDLMIPDATVRGTLRRLAVRGMMCQDMPSRAWQINLPKNVTYQELKPDGPRNQKTDVSDGNARNVGTGAGQDPEVGNLDPANPQPTDQAGT